MYWNDTQSLSMFLQTQLMSILTLSSNEPLITLHSFLTWGNKACNLTVTVTVTNTNQFTTMNLDPWWFTYDPNDELLNCWLPWGDRQRWSSKVIVSLGWLDRWSGPGCWLGTRLVIWVSFPGNPEEVTTCIHYLLLVDIHYH